MFGRSRGDGLHITKVGLWFLVFLGIMAVAATNTGNNGLFLVVAVMAAAVAVSEILGRINVRGLEIELASPGEIFANSPSHLNVKLRNRGRLLPRWLLVTTVEPKDIEPPAHRPRRRMKPVLVPHLPRGVEADSHLELMMRRRGRLEVRFAHVTSLFPLGFFRKGRRYRTRLELLIYPEIFAPSATRPAQLGKSGEEPTRRAGWGHELLGLRTFRQGDDPRSIHWKQTARTGELILKERETEENRRLLIIFDNATGKLASAPERVRFERLISEAATAALDYLDSGYEVSLITREGDLPFASGSRQRLLILEALALIEPRPEAAGVLAPRDSDTPHLRLAMEAATEEVA
ncbi:MAG: DUF58 domain-containing protein [bacterium]|nr:DUF58 domain-containing protein [bacterium]